MEKARAEQWTFVEPRASAVRENGGDENADRCVCRVGVILTAWVPVGVGVFPVPRRPVEHDARSRKRKRLAAYLLASLFMAL